MKVQSNEGELQRELKEGGLEVWYLKTAAVEGTEKSRSTIVYLSPVRWREEGTTFSTPTPIRRSVLNDKNTLSFSNNYTNIKHAIFSNRNYKFPITKTKNQFRPQGGNINRTGRFGVISRAYYRREEMTGLRYSSNSLLRADSRC